MTVPVQDILTFLERQTDLLNRLADQQEELQHLVEQRSWDAMEVLIQSMTHTGEEIALLEEQRHGLFQELALSLRLSGELSGVLAALTPDQREAVSRGYRGLKIAVLRMQSRTAVFDSYMRSTVSTGRGILRELFPEHAGTAYRQDGRGSFPATAPLVVDHQR